MKNLILVPCMCLFLALPACGQESFDEKLESMYAHTVPLIQPRTLHETNPKVILLDIRSEKEFKVSHLPGAQLIDYENFTPDLVKNLPKQSKVVVYCSVGVRSEKIGAKLLDLGFKDVQNLYGGIFQWKNEGYGVVDQNGEATEKVHTYNKNWSKWLLKGEKVYE